MALAFVVGAVIGVAAAEVADFWEKWRASG